jgi:hypothetical protein
MEGVYRRETLIDAARYRTKLTLHQSHHAKVGDSDA